MMENLKEHRVEYFILVVAIIIFMFFIYIYRFDKGALITLTGIGSLFYVLWGIIHHWIRNKITKSVIFEYIIFALFAFLLFYTVLSF